MAGRDAVRLRTDSYWDPDLIAEDEYKFELRLAADDSLLMLGVNGHNLSAWGADVRPPPWGPAAAPRKAPRQECAGSGRRHRPELRRRAPRPRARRQVRWRPGPWPPCPAPMLRLPPDAQRRRRPCRPGAPRAATVARKSGPAPLRDPDWGQFCWVLVALPPPPPPLTLVLGVGPPPQAPRVLLSFQTVAPGIWNEA